LRKGSWRRGLSQPPVTLAAQDEALCKARLLQAMGFVDVTAISHVRVRGPSEYRGRGPKNVLAIAAGDRLRGEHSARSALAALTTRGFSDTGTARTRCGGPAGEKRLPEIIRGWRLKNPELLQPAMRATLRSASRIGRGGKTRGATQRSRRANSPRAVLGRNWRLTQDCRYMPNSEMGRGGDS